MSGVECFFFKKTRLGHFSSCVKSHATNLGIVFDSELRFDRQINTVVKNSFFQLRRIAKLKTVLSKTDLEKVIHAFITSRFGLL